MFEQFAFIPTPVLHLALNVFWTFRYSHTIWRNELNEGGVSIGSVFICLYGVHQPCFTSYAWRGNFRLIYNDISLMKKMKAIDLRGHERAKV